MRPFSCNMKIISLVTSKGIFKKEACIRICCTSQDMKQKLKFIFYKIEDISLVCGLSNPAYKHATSSERDLFSKMTYSSIIQICNLKVYKHQ